MTFKNLVSLYVEAVRLRKGKEKKVTLVFRTPIYFRYQYGHRWIGYQGCRGTRPTYRSEWLDEVTVLARSIQIGFSSLTFPTNGGLEKTPRRNIVEFRIIEP